MLSGKNHPFYGKKHSKESKKKMSKSHKGILPWNTGKKMSKELRKKLSEAHKGHHHSEETKKKMSISRKGRIGPMKGKHLSDEHKAKLSKAFSGKKHPMYGKCHTERTKLKMSKARKGHVPWNKGKKFEAVSGSKNHNWKGGISPINKIIRRSLRYREWREKVFKRDDWTCQKYKIRSKKGIKIYLHPHHIKNFAEYPELRFVTNNGITLSEEAHKEFHKIYGRKNNTKKQLIEFLDRK